MDQNGQQFVEESQGTTSPAPWDMRSGGVIRLREGEMTIGQAEYQAYADAVKGAVDGQKVIVAQAHKIAELENQLRDQATLQSTIDEYRAKVTAKAYVVMDMTKELVGLRQENQNLRDEIEQVREELHRNQLMLLNARDMRALAEAEQAELRERLGDL